MVCEDADIQVLLEEKAVRGATRQINSPFLLRDDVGVLGVLSGNWGGSKRGLQDQVDIDLRSALVAFLMLQEAQPQLVER